MLKKIQQIIQEHCTITECRSPATETVQICSIGFDTMHLILILCHTEGTGNSIGEKKKPHGAESLIDRKCYELYCAGITNFSQAEGKVEVHNYNQ